MASEQMESLKQVMTQMISAGFTPKFDGQLDPFHLRSVVRAAQEQMATEPGVSFLQKEYAGIEAEWSIPDSAQNDYLIFYIHGGGFICGDAFTSRGYASVLAKESGRKVLSVSYPLSPEHPYPAAVDACFAVYQAVIHEYPRLPVFFDRGKRWCLPFCRYRDQSQGCRNQPACGNRSLFLSDRFQWDD